MVATKIDLRRADRARRMIVVCMGVLSSSEFKLAKAGSPSLSLPPLETHRNRGTGKESVKAGKSS
jgi:hypothetical protein